MRVTDAGGAVPHFTLAVACLATGTKLSDALASLPGALTLGARRVPVSGGSLLLQAIARRGGGAGRGAGLPVPGISFAEALAKPPEFFKDQIVLVGETATGTSDVRPNPLDQGLRGVELNAEILANLLALPPVRELPGGAGLALLLAVILAPLVLYSTLPPKPASIGAMAAMALALIVMEAAFQAGRMVPAWSTVGVGSVGATLLMALQRVVQEEQQKRVLRNSFRMYVAPELVEEIVRDPELAAQEGTRQTVAVLFSDIRSFTTYCEGHSPEIIIRQMREYLGGMADAVDACHGVLDKYIGDAVMALFGPFLDDGTEPSALAVACGLSMLDRLAAMNEGWAAEGLQPFKIGIGIHVGEAVVGNIGSPRRMQYTALGDAVNLASRLESNTKELHAEFVVSEDVKNRVETALAEHATFHDLGTITVRNRAQPVRVYEVRRAAAPRESRQP
ncbi:MAG: adenylate/guanylate cyclase domain-containing protein [Armatimonadetes bacterium]|nr:adenylate/guanylate cyclase domain-containing protein [Armatimonadota bacterium]